MHMTWNAEYLLELGTNICYVATGGQWDSVATTIAFMQPSLWARRLPCMHNMLDKGSKTFAWWLEAPGDKGATEGNHRLIALSGAALVPLLALVFLTGLFMETYWHLHYAIGFVLIPVVALKLASTGYRMVRYYTGNPTYRTAGPPRLAPRLLAPLLVLSVASALVTGVALFMQHSRRGVLSTLHTDAAVATALLVGIHLLIYVPDALAAIGREVRRAPPVRAASLRLTLAMTVLVLGIILAIVTYHSGAWPARRFGG